MAPGSSQGTTTDLTISQEDAEVGVGEVLPLF
jgi:hypothetical protein